MISLFHDGAIKAEESKCALDYNSDYIKLVKESFKTTKGPEESKSNKGRPPAVRNVGRYNENTYEKKKEKFTRAKDDHNAGAGGAHEGNVGNVEIVKNFVQKNSFNHKGNAKGGKNGYNTPYAGSNGNNNGGNVNNGNNNGSFTRGGKDYNNNYVNYNNYGYGNGYEGYDNVGYGNAYTGGHYTNGHSNNYNNNLAGSVYNNTTHGKTNTQATNNGANNGNQKPAHTDNNAQKKGNNKGKNQTNGKPKKFK
jgi:hypothetical protein